MSQYCKELRSRFPNLPAFQLALYTIPAVMCTGLIFIISALIVSSSYSADAGKLSMNKSAWLGAFIILHGIFLIMVPVAGWVADTKIGRKRAIAFSLKFSWLGAVIQVISHCIEYATSSTVLCYMARYGLSVIALMLLLSGQGLFLANVYAYGMDQLLEGSNKQIRAFIHWVAGGIIVGRMGISYWLISITNFDILFQPEAQFAMEMLTLTLASMALSGHFLTQNKFYPSGTVQTNPYKTIFDVLRFSIRNKVMQGRSAFTYWENASPSRIDLSKTKYGGPFSEEVVEDVKAFLRIIAVLISIFGIFITYFNIYSYSTKYNKSEKFSKEKHGWGLIESVDMLLVMLLILVELVLLPLFPKVEYFIMNPFKGIGVAFLLHLADVSVNFTIDTALHLTSDKDGNCTPLEVEAPVSYVIFTLPVALSHTSLLLLHIYIFEFVCSQSPSNMIGLITGVFWAIPNALDGIGYVMEYLLFYSKALAFGSLSCTFWILLLHLVISFTGFIIYVIVAKWYRMRQKAVDPNIQAMIEEKYETYLISESYRGGDEIIEVGSKVY